MQHRIRIEDSGEDYQCRPDESLLEGMTRLGRRGIPSGCRGGGCGVCKVQITSGAYQTLAMSRQHVSPEELAQGTVLACRVMAQSDLSLKVLGKLHKNLCRPNDTASSNPPTAAIELV